MSNMTPGFTPMQGRVMFHMERIFRSAGGNGAQAHASFTGALRAASWPVRIDTWSDTQCHRALLLIEIFARQYGMHLFRDVRCTP